MKSFSLVALLFIFSFEAYAKDSNEKKSNIKFDEILVQGKYKVSKGSVTTVDDRSLLDSLVGVRKNFKQKVESSRLQY